MEQRKHAMAATDGQIVVAAARWSTDEVLSLRDYVAQNDVNNQQQQQQRTEVVKFVRGQYASVGVPNLPNPSLHANAVLTSFGKTVKVAAQSVKFKDGKRHCAVASGLRFSIPESYPGYFEILSEEGKAVRCIDSVLELAKKLPDCVLVRENVRAFVTPVPLMELSADKSRTVGAGEILTLKKEVSLAARSRSNRFLQCLDSKGDIVYLNLEQRGKFSPIARNDNISGVHTLRQLITNKRLPLMVRLVWGPPPFKGTSGVAQPSELRLFSTFEEDSVFALPLGHNSGKQEAGMVVPLPLGCNLKLVRARNQADLRHLDQFQRLAATAARASRDIHSRMTVLETFKDSISFWNLSPGHSKFAGAKVSAKNIFLRRSISHESHMLSSPVISEPPADAPTQDFLEIDQIYDYVRGFAPLPKSLRSNNNSNNKQQQQQQQQQKQGASEQKPKPPPIETIPTNKLNAAAANAKAKQQQQAAKEAAKEQKQAAKPASKTALKMEMHAQNLAQESLKAKRLFKSKTTSSIADHHLIASPEPLEKVIDLSYTHLLTQADFDKHNDSAGDDTEEDDPTYENTTQVYLESGGGGGGGGSGGRKYASRQKATSEMGSAYKKNSSSHNESSRNLIIRNKQKRSGGGGIGGGGGGDKASKSHEDLAAVKKCQSQPESPSSVPEQHPLYNSLSNLRSTPPSTEGSRERRRGHLSKQRSLSSLLAEASPHTPVIEHKPVELHLHLSRNSGGNQKLHHHTKSKASKLGIMYL